MQANGCERGCETEVLHWCSPLSHPHLGHRVVIASRCPYFQELLSSLPTNQVCEMECRVEIFSEVLRFIYFNHWAAPRVSLSRIQVRPVATFVSAVIAWLRLFCFKFCVILRFCVCYNCDSFVCVYVGVLSMNLSSRARSRFCWTS